MATGVEDKHRAQALLDRQAELDRSWEQYLTLLDQYTTAQTTIQKELSNGFFSLAQANFKSSSRRYGQDYYDQRAISTVRVRCGATNEDEESLEQKWEVKLEKVEIPSHNEDGYEEELREKLDAANFDDEAEEEEASPEPSESPSDENFTSTEKRPEINIHDPIRQFGILIPPDLRKAQKSFSNAVLSEDCVAKAVRAARAMRKVEAEIRKLRKEVKKLEREGKHLEEA